MSRIFISYRRDDTAPYAGRLYENLAARFGDDNVFMDIDTLEPGVDFVEVIENAVGTCDVVLVLIGKQWLSITDAAGRRRRLDNPEDFVRLEVATALERNIRVVPLLVESATMPRSSDLPDVLQKLTRRNAATLRTADWRYDVSRLIAALEKVLASVTSAAPAQPAVEPDLRLDADAVSVANLSAQLDQAEAAANWNQVIELGEQILTADTNDQPTRTKTATAYKQRGLSLRDQGEYDRAIADFSRALILDPSQIDLRYWRGDCYGKKSELEQGEPDFYRTIADCSEAISLNPTIADYYYWRGDSYGWLKQYDRAIADLSRAIALNPNKAIYYRERGASYYLQGDYEQALVDYTRAIELAPNVADYYYARGLSYVLKDNHGQALLDYTRAVELAPNVADYYRQRGVSYNNQGDYDHALVDYTRAIELAPNVANYYRDRGVSYNNQGDYDHALADFNRAIDLKPNVADYYRQRGASYYLQGDYERALVDYTRAIELAPNVANGYYARGRTYKAKGGHTAAKRDFQRAADLGHAEAKQELAKI